LARKYSKRKLRRLWSFILIALACLAVLFAVAAFHSGSIGRAFDYLAAAGGSVAVVLAFTWPVRCRVITARGRECRNEAYGVLFGCYVRAQVRQVLCPSRPAPGAGTPAGRWPAANRGSNSLESGRRVAHRKADASPSTVNL